MNLPPHITKLHAPLQVWEFVENLQREIETVRAAQRRAIGIGYTLATGNLYCDFNEFHEYAQKLIARPIEIEELADQKTWDELRERYESLVKELSLGGGTLARVPISEPALTETGGEVRMNKEHRIYELTDSEIDVLNGKPVPDDSDRVRRG